MSNQAAVCSEVMGKKCTSEQQADEFVEWYVSAVRGEAEGELYRV
jgi:hypothetical protein